MNIQNLNPNKKNPRKISEKKLEMLKKSLLKFGDLSGFVYNVRSKQLISGHQRQKILKDGEIVIEKEYKAPTISKTVSEGYVTYNGERFKYREVEADEIWESEALLAANKHGGEFDDTLLQDILTVPGLSLELTGFELPEIKFDITNLKVETDEEYVANTPDVTEQIPVENPSNIVKPVEPEPEEPSEIIARVKLGERWQLGTHTLVCDNALDVELDKFDIVYTDPPYGINEQTDRAFASRTRLAEGNTFKKIVGDDSTETALNAFELAKELSNIICFWGGNYYDLPPSPCWIVWDKRVEENQRDMNSDCELAYVKHPTKKSVRIFRHLWKGMIKGSEHGQKRVHPTQKPIALAEWCLNELAPESKTVLDLFGGSGSTLLACEKTNRKCFIIEIDPHYCDVIIARWEKFTSKMAIKLK